MLKIYTVCGNGIGSSLMCRVKVEEICEEMGIKADVNSTDFSQASGLNCDLIVTIKELAQQLPDKHCAVIRSYTNKNKIREDIEEYLITLTK